MRHAFQPGPGSKWFAGLLLLLAPQALSQITSTTTEDGLKIDVMVLASCTRRSQNGDTIHVHYNGTLEDGTPFDSSYKRAQPFTFQLGAHRVIAGWDEGLLDMCIGEERMLTIPPSLGYGNRAMGPIPGGSTLIFGTKLMGIDGVPDDQDPLQPPVPSVTSLPPVSSTLTSSTSSTLSTPSTTTTTALTTTATQPPKATSTSPADGNLDDEQPGTSNGECRLLGPFALFVQAGLGAVAVLSLVFKRYRERPRRPVKVWFFDVSKQVLGSVLLHILNLLFSMFSSGNFELATVAQSAQYTGQFKETITAQVQEVDGHKPNPCSFYLINLAIDTTIGVPILFVLLKLLHHAFSLTPLAKPQESIRSGHYGQPPKSTWWLKQSLIYFIGLVLMKLCVLFLFTILPWIAWVGDWALRWTEGSEALQIAFVMFVFPVIMNALQYYIIDGFIKDSSGGEHQLVPTADHSSEEDDRFEDDAFREDSDGETFVDEEQDKGHSKGPTPTIRSTDKDASEEPVSEASSVSGRSNTTGHKRVDQVLGHPSI